MIYYHYINTSYTIPYHTIKTAKYKLLSTPLTKKPQFTGPQHILTTKVNENLFTPFSTPTILGQSATIPITIFPTLLIPTSKHLINNQLVTIQQNFTKLTLKQIIAPHNAKGQSATIPITIFPTLLIPTSKHLINNQLVTIQQNFTKLTLKQIIAPHNAKGQS
uniref:Uncharacterized protein n=1 Tax=Theropithecus gelada TaxID=9565 RepID=A0A8D2GFT0_THEGE